MYRNCKSRFVSVLIIICMLSGFVFCVPATSVKAADEYDAIRIKWYNILTGGTGYNTSDPDIASYINYIAEIAQNRWDTLDKSADRTYLWSDMSSTVSSWHVAGTFVELRTMALAYSISGSPLYHNSALKTDIINAMDWMYSNRYNENITQYDNWYHWQISGPLAANDVLVLMYSDMTSAQINNYIRAIDHFTPEPSLTGANKTEMAMVVALRGVLGKSSAKIALGRDALSEVFLYVTSSDGFYEDGSFIFHEYVPYIGNYGYALLKSITNILSLLHDTTWKVTDPNLSNVWDWIPDSYEPFIYKGGMMDMVKGRYFGTEDHVSGRATIISILRLADLMPTDRELTCKKMIKEWVLSDTTFTNYYDSTEFTINEIVKLKQILGDPSIARRGDLVMNKVYPSMARTVHLRPGFGFGISMFSNTITAFQYGNGSNKNGWFTGVGMTYLFNNDLNQYTNIADVINMKRLPGTTTDGSGGAADDWHKYPNPKTWVGGSAVENLYGSTGMDFTLSQNTGSTLTGKKSWFMFADKVVALGAGITSTDNLNVETIVENRQLNSSGSNALTVNGTVKPSTVGWSETMTSVNWAHLAGSVPGADIGYYFPASSTIHGLREKREKSVNITAEADAYVRDGSYANTNYGTDATVTTRLDGVGYNTEGYYRFNLSNVAGTIVSAKVKLYTTGTYAEAPINKAEKVANNIWKESELTWNNKPASTGTALVSWDPATGSWVTIDVTADAVAAMNGDKKISIRTYSTTPTLEGKHMAYYATRENSNASYRPYIEIVTDTTTDRYLSLAFQHGINPSGANYAYALLPNKTAAQMSAYASNPDITILENSVDAQAVKDKTLNAVGINFWNNKTKTVLVDGGSYITSDKAASVTTLEEGNQFSVGLSDPTKSNAGSINVEINKTASSIISSDPGITVTQLSPAIKMKVNVNGANGKSFNAKFNIIP